MLRKMITEALSKKNFFFRGEIKEPIKTEKVETEQEYNYRMECIANEAIRQANKCN